MGVETSPSFTIGGGVPADPDANVKQSPLWPLQQQLRGLVRTALNDGSLTATQIAVLTAPYSLVKEKFSMWRAYTSATNLRNVIRELLDPKFLDVASDPILSDLQTQLLSASHWNDSLTT